MSRRRRYLMIAVLAVAVLFGVLIVSRFPHLRWLAQRRRLGPVHRVDVAKLEVPVFSEPTQKCGIGGIRFQMPESLARQTVIRPQLLKSASVSGWFTLENDIFTIAVNSPRDAAQDLGNFDKSLPCYIPKQERSLIRIRAEAYRVDDSDFDIWMSYSALERHKLLVATRYLMKNLKSPETRFDEQIEGILTEFEGKWTFEWFSADGTAGGSLRFIPKSHGMNLDVVRVICATMQFDGETFPIPANIEYVRRVLDTTTFEIPDGIREAVDAWKPTK